MKDNAQDLVLHTLYTQFVRLGIARIRLITLIVLTIVEFGASGGTRTHTTFYGPGILSPVRLPFRHAGLPAT